MRNELLLTIGRFAAPFLVAVGINYAKDAQAIAAPFLAPPTPGVLRPFTHEIPQQFEVKQMHTSGNAIVTLIAYQDRQHLVKVEFKPGALPRLIKLAEVPFIADDFDISKTDPNIILVGGRLEVFGQIARFGLTKNGGSSWDTFDHRNGEIQAVKITPDNRYAYVIHALDNPNGNSSSHVAQIDIQNTSISDVPLPFESLGFCCFSDIRQDQFTNSYTQYAAQRTPLGDPRKGYFKITHGPTGSKAKYIVVENTSPLAIYPVDRNDGKNEVWMLDNISRRIFRIVNDSEFAGRIDPALELYPPPTVSQDPNARLALQNLYINSVVFDPQKDRSFIATAIQQIYATPTDGPYPRISYVNTPYIEAISASDPGNKAKRIVIPKNGDFPPVGAIWHMQIVKTQTDEYLVIGVTSYTDVKPDQYRGLYYLRITNGLTSSEPWRKIYSTYRTFLPDNSR